MEDLEKRLEAKELVKYPFQELIEQIILIPKSKNKQIIKEQQEILRIVKN